MDSHFGLQLLARAAEATLSALAIGWILRKVRLSLSPAANTSRTLRYHKSYLYMGWFSFIFFGGVGIAAVITIPNGYQRYLVAFLGLATLIGLPLLGFYHRCSLTYTEYEIRNVPLWGEPFSFVWSDVEKVTFSGSSHWWVLKLRSGESVRVCLFMNGAVEFMRTLALKNPIRIPDGTTHDGKKIVVRAG